MPHREIIQQDAEKPVNTEETGSAATEAGEQMLPSQYAQQKMVNVLIGENKKSFLLHRSLVCAKSEYFATRLKECWDGEKCHIELKDAAVNGFEVVVDWIYLDKLPSRLTNMKDVAHYPWGMIDDAYKVADQLLMESLQNELVNNNLAIFRGKPYSWTLSKVKTMWDAELSHTPYYQLVLKSCVRNLMSKPSEPAALEKDLESLVAYPHALKDVISQIAMWNKRPWPAVGDGSFCEFHVHTDGKKCK